MGMQVHSNVVSQNCATPLHHTDALKILLVIAWIESEAISRSEFQRSTEILHSETTVRCVGV